MALVLFLGFVLPVINIQLRLWRNGAIAAQIVESLRTRFPGANFGGSANYQSEEISIWVKEGMDPERFPEVVQWLRKLKAEQKIAPTIHLGSYKDPTREKETVIP